MTALLWLSSECSTLGQTNEPIAASAKASTNRIDFAPDLNAVTADLKTKFDASQTNAADLQTNLAAINALIVKHLKDGNREQVARLYLLDAHIYADALNDKTRARAIWNQVARNYPGTQAAIGASLSLQLNVPEGLAIGQRFPDFSAADVSGNPMSVSAHRGQVTLVDFWATWCEPCKAEMPNVINAYQTYHGQGFDIVGVSLDQDRNALANYTDANHMPWPQYFDGQGRQNQLAQRYGIRSIPANYLLNRNGIIVAKDLREERLAEAVAKALAGN